MPFIILVLIIATIVFFLKQWIYFGIEVAAMRTLRFIIVIGILAIILIMAWYKGQQ